MIWTGGLWSTGSGSGTGPATRYLLPETSEPEPASHTWLLAMVNHGNRPQKFNLTRIFWSHVFNYELTT